MALQTSTNNHDDNQENNTRPFGARLGDAMRVSTTADKARAFCDRLGQLYRERAASRSDTPKDAA